MRSKVDLTSSGMCSLVVLWTPSQPAMKSHEIWWVWPRRVKLMLGESLSIP